MTHDERMHQLLYSNEGRVEQCERICRLEELVRDAITAACDRCGAVAMCRADRLAGAGYGCPLAERAHKLGVEVPDA